MQPRDVIAAIAPKTADLGAAFYFHPTTLARGKELGLDGFRFYVLGRGGVLGDVEPDVVRSAFGYFEPGLVARMWNSSKEIMSPRDAAREYLACAAELGRSKFGGLDGLDGYNAAAAAVIDAVDPAALPLFAGVRAEATPDDAPGLAMHHTVVLRELRGSVHLAAIAASCLTTAVAHAIKRPADVKLFGYSDPPHVRDEDREAWEHAEALTNDMLVRPFSVLDDEGGAALVAGTDAMHAAINA